MAIAYNQFKYSRNGVLDMTYDNINAVLLERLPELAVAIQKEYDYWKEEKVPSYCLYEGVLNSSGFMDNLLLEETNMELIKKVFDLYEDMATCDDVEVRNLLQVGLLEYLWSSVALLTTAHKYMHPQTRSLCDKIQAYLRYPQK